MADSTACTCGGCGTGTTCCHDNTTIKGGSIDGVYAYMGPEVRPQDGYPYPPPTFPQLGTEESMRNILQEEIIRDLLDRVRRNEKKLGKVQQELKDINAALDAIQDFMDSVDDDVPDYLKPLLRYLRS